MRRAVGAIILGCLLPAGAANLQAAGLVEYETPYYILATDIDVSRAPDIAQRMTRMAEEYHQRTRSFSGEIRRKFRFELYRWPEDYYAAGGPSGSGGVYTYRGRNDGKLMAIAGEKTGERTWHVIQHEGFHQFAHQVMGGARPPWLNEGLAEYFGHSVFVGDGFVSGVLPTGRVKRIQLLMQNDKFMPLEQMMLLSQGEWNAELQSVNYDMGWSLVQFLAHGDNDKYQKPFERFMIDIGRGADWRDVWLKQFGSIRGFEQRWRNYWLNLEESPSRDLYRKAGLSILTSYLARANLQGERYDDYDAMITAIKVHRSSRPSKDALPNYLVDSAFRWLDDVKEAKIENHPNGSQEIHLTLSDGQYAIGQYTRKGKRIKDVKAVFDGLPAILKQAQTLIDAGDYVQARQLLQKAVADHSRSRFVTQARALMIQARPKP